MQSLHQVYFAYSELMERNGKSQNHNNSDADHFIFSLWWFLVCLCLQVIEQEVLKAYMLSVNMSNVESSNQYIYCHVLP